jgi:hypothetical protein
MRPECHPLSHQPAAASEWSHSPVPHLSDCGVGQQPVWCVSSRGQRRPAHEGSLCVYTPALVPYLCTALRRLYATVTTSPPCCTAEVAGQGQKLVQTYPSAGRGKDSPGGVCPGLWWSWLRPCLLALQIWYGWFGSSTLCTAPPLPPPGRLSSHLASHTACYVSCVLCGVRKLRMS